jgi:GNAT acetyltransferase-like protein
VRAAGVAGTSDPKPSEQPFPPMKLRILQPTVADWERLIGEFEDVNLIQTYAWGEAKRESAKWVPERLVFEESGEVVGAAQALVRRLPARLGGMVWLNRGPLCRRDGGPPSLADQMLMLLHEHYVDRQRMYMRVAPTVCADGGGALRPTRWAGYQAGRFSLAMSEDELRMHFKQKWRNCLYKAERLGTDVRIGADEQIFARFLAAYDANLAHVEYKKSTTPDLLRSMQRHLPEDRRMTVFEAVEDGDPVGWLLIGVFGHTAEYVAAVSQPRARALNAGQLLAWHAVREMKRRGYAWFDVGGWQPEDSASGIAHFKAGLNATPYRLPDELEGYGNPLKAYAIRRAVDRARTGMLLGNKPDTHLAMPASVAGSQLAAAGEYVPLVAIAAQSVVV